MTYFGNIQGPFTADEEVFTKIQEQHQEQIQYLSKLGIHYVGNFNLDLTGTYWKKILVRINGIEFQIGATRMLELENIQATSIQFVENVNDKVYIDYQYSN